MNTWTSDYNYSYHLHWIWPLFLSVYKKCFQDPVSPPRIWTAVMLHSGSMGFFVQFAQYTDSVFGSIVKRNIDSSDQTSFFRSWNVQCRLSLVQKIRFLWFCGKNKEILGYRCLIKPIYFKIRLVKRTDTLCNDPQ